MVYAKIENGKITEKQVWDKEPPAELGLKRVDNIDPPPRIDWDYDEGTKKFTDNRPRDIPNVAPTKLGDIDLSLNLNEDAKELILKKMAQDMIDKGIE